MVGDMTNEDIKKYSLEELTAMREAEGLCQLLFVAISSTQKSAE